MNPIYPESTFVPPIIFDTEDPKQAELLEAFRAAFGAEYAPVEDLAPPQYRALRVLPGGANGVRR